jgi:hypothetical protein
MKHLIIALGLSMLGIITPITSVAQATPNITGDWVIQATGDQLLSGTLHLTQVGDTVVGSADAKGPQGSGVLQINGTLQGNKLSGKWRSPKGNVGWITLNFQPSFHAFSGEWGYGGRKPNGMIVSKKFVATAF